MTLLACLCFNTCPDIQGDCGEATRIEQHTRTARSGPREGKAPFALDPRDCSGPSSCRAAVSYYTLLCKRSGYFPTFAPGASSI